MPDINERRLNRFEAADFLCRLGYRVAHATLSKYVTVGGGPEYEKFGRRPLYTEQGLLNWVRDRTTLPDGAGGVARRLDRITRTDGGAVNSN